MNFLEETTAKVSNCIFSARTRDFFLQKLVDNLLRLIKGRTHTLGFSRFSSSGVLTKGPSQVVAL